VKLSGEDFCRYVNKIESAGFRKCPYYHYLLRRKWCHNNKHFSDLAPHHVRKNSWHRYSMRRNYFTVTLCILYT